MILNEHHQTDVRYVVEQSNIMFRILGIWSSVERQPTTIEWIANVSVMILCYLLLNSNMVPGLLYYVYVDDDPHEKVKMLPPILYSVMAIAKYSSLLLRKNDIRGCLLHVKEDWRTILVDGARDVMIDRTSTSRRLFTICCGFMYCGGVCYNTIVPLSRGSVVTDQNVTIRPLSCPGYYIFFDAQESPAYELVFLSQCLGGIVMYTITVAICGFAALCVMHASAQMEILMRLMKGLVEEDGPGRGNVRAKLALVIEHQIRIRNFLRLVEETLRYSSLVEIVGCATILCLVGFCIKGEWEDRNYPAICIFIIAISSVIIAIFILCYIGEYITMQAEEVNMTFCTLEWYLLPTTVAHDMVLVTAATSMPLKITAGKFIDLSIKTFGDVIKSAVVYFNLLRQLTE